MTGMTGEEIAGPAGPKLFRLLSFVGAGVICAAAINKWRDLERNSVQQKHKLPDTQSSAAYKALK